MISIFERYNARWLDPEDIAKTFVPPAQFEELASPRHSVILGPRGSGKTTLLKMLTRRGLDLWQHGAADAYRQRVQFTGVFIGSDRAWEGQLSSVGGTSLDEKSRTAIATAAFTTHVLRALTEAATYKISAACTSGSFAPKIEADLVQTVARLWGINAPVPSLLGLKRGLAERLVALGRAAGELAFSNELQRAEVLRKGDFHLNYLSAAIAAVDLFDDAFETAGVFRSRWALLFDELEIAPRWLRRELFRQLRSVDNRFIFKLALSPHNRDLEMEVEPTAPRPGNDYDEIKLWYTHRVDAEDFSRSLWQEIATSHGLTAGPEEVLGTSFFETPDEEWIGKETAYRVDSAIGKKLAKLANRDRAFAEYLRAHAINLSALDMLPPERRAATLRKVYPIASFRAAFRRTQDAIETSPARQQGLKSKKKAPAGVYSGAAAMFAMLEGNPRWFIGVINKLLDGARPGRAINRRRQVDVLTTATHRFRALLKSLPVDHFMPRDLQLLNLIDEIANVFSAAVLGDTFDPDPPGTFVVPSNADEALTRVLELGLDAGALILVPASDSAITTSTLREKRIRLSYLLAPVFSLPLRLGRPISLTTILHAAPYRGRARSGGPHARR